MNLSESLQKVVQPERNLHESISAFALKYVSNRPTNFDFTSEEILDKFRAYYGQSPAEPRVMGAIMREMIKSKLIYQSGYTKSKKPGSHQRQIATYRRVIQ